MTDNLQRELSYSQNLMRSCCEFSVLLIKSSCWLSLLHCWSS